jgi:transglutaminase-like putative cysteine protease
VVAKITEEHAVTQAVRGSSETPPAPAGPAGRPVESAADAAFVDSCRRPTDLLDSGHPDVRRFADAAVGSAEAPREKAVRLYYAVRDLIRYDPFVCSAQRDDYRASRIAVSARNWCVPKAGLLAAAARAVGIPAAVGLADVTNHLNTEKLRRAMGGTDVFFDHGYAGLWIEGRWVKAAAVFNIELCERFGVEPVEFDGEHDALLQEYDAARRRHMQYLADHGLFVEMPFEKVMADFAAHYPSRMLEPGGLREQGPRFEDDRPA